MLQALTSLLLVGVMLTCPYGCLGKAAEQGNSVLTAALGCCGSCGQGGASRPLSPGCCVPEADCLCHGAVLQARGHASPAQQVQQPTGAVPLLAAAPPPARAFVARSSGCLRLEEPTEDSLGSGRCALLGVFLC